jgi:uncharacterized protein YqkB
MKEGFDSETNAEFIPVWVRDRQAVLVIRNAVFEINRDYKGIPRVLKFDNR